MQMCVTLRQGTARKEVQNRKTARVPSNAVRLGDDGLVKNDGNCGREMIGCLGGSADAIVV